MTSLLANAFSLQTVVYGLSIAAIYFMVSISLSVGYGLMRIVNLEAMLYYSVGAYMTYQVVEWTGSFVLGCGAAAIVGGFLGFLVETQLLRRLYSKNMMFTMVTTFSVFLIGIGLIQYIWGLNPKPIKSPTSVIVHFLNVDIPLYRLIVILVATSVYILFQLFLKKTIAGKAITAGIENSNNVQALGINIYKIFTITFVFASAMGGLGGALNAPFVMVAPYMGFDFLLFGFTTVILGGLGSMKGTMVSALILGQLVSIGGTIAPFMSYMGPFITMFLVILFKPTGLFGIKSKAFGFE
jgi:branched-chain amino acid transport system permease protein